MVLIGILKNVLVYYVNFFKHEEKGKMSAHLFLVWTGNFVWTCMAMTREAREFDDFLYYSLSSSVLPVEMCNM